MDIPAGLERRLEDYPLITGTSHYVDDLRSPRGRPATLHMVVVRSPYAHARINNIQLDAARAIPGVVAVFAGKEMLGDMRPIEAMGMPGLKRPERWPLAVDKVRYMGDPVAVVLAEDRYTAQDARDLIEVDYEPLPGISDPETAVASDAPLLYEEFGSNIAFDQHMVWGDVESAFAQADHVVCLRVVNQRIAANPIEPRACMFDFDPASGQFLAWVSSQAVFRARETLATFLGLDRSKIRVHNAAVGGGFGTKTAFVGEELLAAILAMKLGRPVKWIESRGENLQAQTQARGQINYIEAAVKNDGRLLGLRVRSFADLGAYLANTTAMVPSRVPTQLSGPYQVQAVESSMIGVFTNKAPTAAYRGAGRPEATYILERTMERIARELGLDPIAVRRRNFIPPEAFPFTTVTGLRYDSGNYEAALDRALELADYEGWQEEQRRRRVAGDSRLLGIGLSTFNEISGDGGGMPGPKEAATVRIRRDGTVLVQSGVSTNGQGHFTLFTQIAANTFNLPVEKIEVQMNDASLPGFSIGTFGSRVTQMGGSAVLLAAEATRDKALQVAARVLEAAPADLVLENGKVTVRGVPARSIELGELARMVEEQPDLIEHEAPNPANGTPIEGLAAWHDFAASGAGFSSGTHIAIVEVESETGEVRILRFIAVDDCGRVINHYMAEAQMHGGLAQGIGQALYEEVVYDEDGQLLTGSLMDYSLPIATMVPTYETDFVETPSPTNPLGAKGVGESGTIGAPPAIVNAVLDALAPLGVTAIDMPLKPEKVWAIIQQARRDNS
ncbi:MAG TPA: xanthine dehydrogenase family protein molybdopterin-binding subunit [Ktedonobacteraceae bacterium]|nr:xanthine dehydrogenase family protein molybdopterin-binding subunit [Ktedonobacteraceae bacterium]